MIESGPSVLGTGSSSEDFGDDHAAGFSAALTKALEQVNERYVGQYAVIDYGARLGSGSVTIDTYYAVIRDPVADLDWKPPESGGDG